MKISELKVLIAIKEASEFTERPINLKPGMGIADVLKAVNERNNRYDILQMALIRLSNGEPILENPQWMEEAGKVDPDILGKSEPVKPERFIKGLWPDAPEG